MEVFFLKSESEHFSLEQFRPIMVKTRTKDCVNILAIPRILVAIVTSGDFNPIYYLFWHTRTVMVGTVTC